MTTPDQDIEGLTEALYDADLELNYEARLKIAAALRTLTRERDEAREALKKAEWELLCESDRLKNCRDFNKLYEESVRSLWDRGRIGPARRSKIEE